jgi:hypothetical protein
MNASIDKDPAGEGEDARGVLSSWLDDFAAGKCEREDMVESFLSVCRSNADAPWDALALLDQYQRRGKIDPGLVRELKAQIAQLVFGVASQTEAPRDSEATLDTSGSRWRKLMSERDPGTINSAPAESEPDDPDEDEEEEEEDDISAPPTIARPSEPTRPRAPRSSSSPAPPIQPTLRTPVVKPTPIAETKVGRSATGSQPSAPPASSAAAQGRRVLRDRYELISIIGRGSMGTVYRALDRHRAHLPEASRRVAIKLFKPDCAEGPDRLVSLEQQFHLAQSLAHPNVVRVFDLDRDGDAYFLVMELLEGELLSGILRRLEGRPMDKDKALAVIGQIGAALLYAHRRDAVHGDLKPRNVMITYDGEIKVLDFGFARRQPLERHAAEALQDDLVMAAAAPAYASMERAFGEPPQASDDVYSLACIAYELLSGAHPYGGRSGTFARSHGRDPKRISTLTHRQWHALSKALRPARADRKIGLEELLQALGCLDVRPQVYTPHELASRQPESKRVGRRLAIAAFVFAASIGIIMFSLRQIDASLAPSSVAPATLKERANAREDVAAPTEETHAESPAPSAPADASPPADDERSAPTPAPATDSTREAATPPNTQPATRASAPATASAGIPSISFDNDTYVASESDGSVRLIVKRSGSLREEAWFRWTLKSNSAEAGTDFAAIGPGRERFAPGVASVGLTIPLVSDAIPESTELFQVELSDFEGAAPGQTTTASVIIVDDD